MATSASHVSPAGLWPARDSPAHEAYTPRLGADRVPNVKDMRVMTTIRGAEGGETISKARGGRGSGGVSSALTSRPTSSASVFSSVTATPTPTPIPRPPSARPSSARSGHGIQPHTESRSYSTRDAKAREASSPRFDGKRNAQRGADAHVHPEEGPQGLGHILYRVQSSQKPAIMTRLVERQAQIVTPRARKLLTQRTLPQRTAMDNTCGFAFGSAPSASSPRAASASAARGRPTSVSGRKTSFYFNKTTDGGSSKASAASDPMKERRSTNAAFTAASNHHEVNYLRDELLDNSGVSLAEQTRFELDQFEFFKARRLMKTSLPLSADEEALFSPRAVALKAAVREIKRERVINQTGPLKLHINLGPSTYSTTPASSPRQPPSSSSSSSAGHVYIRFPYPYDAFPTPLTRWLRLMVTMQTHPIIVTLRKYFFSTELPTEGKPLFDEVEMVRSLQLPLLYETVLHVVEEGEVEEDAKGKPERTGGGNIRQRLGNNGQSSMPVPVVRRGNREWMERFIAHRQQLLSNPELSSAGGQSGNNPNVCSKLDHAGKSSQGTAKTGAGPCVSESDSVTQPYISPTTKAIVVWAAMAHTERREPRGVPMARGGGDEGRGRRQSEGEPTANVSDGGEAEGQFSCIHLQPAAGIGSDPYMYPLKLAWAYYSDHDVLLGMPYSADNFRRFLADAIYGKAVGQGTANPSAAVNELDARRRRRRQELDDAERARSQQRNRGVKEKEAGMSSDVSQSLAEGGPHGTPISQRSLSFSPSHRHHSVGASPPPVVRVLDSGTLGSAGVGTPPSTVLNISAASSCVDASQRSLTAPFSANNNNSKSVQQRFGPSSMGGGGGEHNNVIPVAPPLHHASAFTSTGDTTVCNCQSEDSSIQTHLGKKVEQLGQTTEAPSGADQHSGGGELPPSAPWPLSNPLVDPNLADELFYALNDMSTQRLSYPTGGLYLHLLLLRAVPSVQQRLVRVLLSISRKKMAQRSLEITAQDFYTIVLYIEQFIENCSTIPASTAHPRGQLYARGYAPQSHLETGVDASVIHTNQVNNPITCTSAHDGGMKCEGYPAHVDHVNHYADSTKTRTKVSSGSSRDDGNVILPKIGIPSPAVAQLFAQYREEIRAFSDAIPKDNYALHFNKVFEYFPTGSLLVAHMFEDADLAVKSALTAEAGMLNRLPKYGEALPSVTAMTPHGGSAWKGVSRFALQKALLEEVRLERQRNPRSSGQAVSKSGSKAYVDRPPRVV